MPNRGPNSGSALRFPPGPNTDKIAARFWPRVDKSAGPDGCWPWTGSKHDRHGYGAFCRGPRGSGKALAHRIAWGLTHGEVPPGTVLLHRCDNPPCCNPAHLSAGTQAKNSRDAWERGRQPRFRPSRLANKAQIDAIWSRYTVDKKSQREIAAEFGMAKSQIGAVVRILRCLYAANDDYTGTEGSSGVRLAPP